MREGVYDEECVNRYGTAHVDGHGDDDVVGSGDDDNGGKLGCNVITYGCVVVDVKKAIKVPSYCGNGDRNCDVGGNIQSCDDVNSYGSAYVHVVLRRLWFWFYGVIYL